MEYEKHIQAGLVAATAATASTIAVGFEPMVFPVTLFFSLFPDLDTNSIPQRWTYRILILIVSALSYYGFYKESVFISILFMTPLVDHHRGWTHALWAPLFFPFLAFSLYFSFVSGIHPFDVDWIHELRTHWKVIFGGIFGWYVHLFIDNR